MVNSYAVRHGTTTIQIPLFWREYTCFITLVQLIVKPKALGHKPHIFKSHFKRKRTYQLDLIHIGCSKSDNSGKDQEHAQQISSGHEAKIPRLPSL